MSIQFEPLPGYRSPLVGFLWRRLQDRYPTMTEQAPLDPVFETFGGPRPAMQPALTIEQFTFPPPIRYWFESADGHSLMQVQRDRVIHNWRKMGTDAEYPRYEAVRLDYELDIAAFQAFVADENLGEIRPNQAEISYINVIELPDGSDPHGALEQVFLPWRKLDTSELLSEGALVNAKYQVQRDGKPFARLHVTVAPALRMQSHRPVVKLEFTFRGRPDHETVASALDFIHEGRAKIVNTFAVLTPADLHRHWGRTDG